MTTTSVDSLLAQADLQAQSGRYGEAFNILAQAYPLAPHHVGVLTRIGVCLLLTKNADRSIPYLQQAATLASTSSDILTHLGTAYAITNQFPAAEATLQQAIRYNPSSALPSKLLALVEVEQNRYAEARQRIVTLVQSHPADVEALLLLALFQECDGNHSSAAELYRQILSIEPQDVDAHAGLSRLSKARGQPVDRRALMGSVDPRSIVMLVDDRRIDRRVLDEARSLGQAGWRVTVIAGEPPVVNPLWDEECYPDIDIVRVTHGKILSVRCLGNIARYAVRLNTRQPEIDNLDNHLDLLLPDHQWRPYFEDHREFYLEAIEHPAAVYVAHDLPQLPAGAMAALQFGSYLVYDAHELFPEQFSDEPTRVLYSKMETSLSVLADKVIAVNQSIADIMKERYHVEPHVILNCPSVASQQLPVPRSNMLQQKLGLPDHARVLLFQGGLMPKLRNLENLVAAMKLIRHNDVVLVLMGSDSGARAQLLKSAHDNNLLGSRIFFLDAVRQDELLAYTASADAGIIPYIAHGLLNQYFCTPNKLFEFIVAGLPILANDLPELNRFVSRQGVGLNLPMMTPEDIALAIDTFFDADLGFYRARLKEISRGFEWQNEGRKVVEIYGSLQHNPPKSSYKRLLLEAEQHIQTNDLVSARDKLVSVVRASPNDVQALNDMAIVESLRGDLESSRELLERALARDPSNPHVKENLRQLGFEQNHHAGPGRENLTILVVLHYPTRSPLRATIRDHIYAFSKYSHCKVHYLNYWEAYHEDPSAFQGIKFDLIIFHTVFLSARWNPDRFRQLMNSPMVKVLKESDAVKIALPQDEFLNTDMLCDFINDFGISHVFSVAPASEWPKIYHKVDSHKVKFFQVLTGYLDDDTLSRIRTLSHSMKDLTRSDRTIDIGYRAWRAAYWLGRHGSLKWQIADAFQKEALQHGLQVDISTREEDTFQDDDWYLFLMRCKYFIGVEGGASILDRDGAIKKKTEDYIALHPGAEFDEVEAACFPNVDGGFKLFAISPRNLEACSTRTCQILVEGEYNGILKPGKHYIELKRDFSNIEEVLNIVAQDTLREEITERAYHDIVESDKYSYRSFVEFVIDNALPDAASASSTDRGAAPALLRQATKVDEYWSAHTVNSTPFSSAADSQKYLEWRFDQYPLFKEFMQLYGNHDRHIVLDYGCGPGNDLVGFSLQTNAKKVIGLDVSAKALDLAKGRLALHNINGNRVELIKSSDTATQIPLDDCTVDYVYCEGVLHHTTNPQAILNQFFRILKPSSDACIMVYNRNSIWVHLYTAYYKMILQEAFPGLTIEEAFSRNTDGESCPISRCYADEEFSRMCKGAGFESEFVGGYFSLLELDMLKQYGDIALRELRLPDEHRTFLRNLQQGRRGFPLYQGKHAGIGGVYRLHKNGKKVH